MVECIEVEVTRGNQIESIHKVAVSIAGPKDIYLYAGDENFLFYPRSSAKIIQQLPLVISQTDVTFGFTGQQLALACASHTAEPNQVAEVEGILSKSNLDASFLMCGPMAPVSSTGMFAFAQDNKNIKRRIYNMCSGKHAAMLAVCMQKGWDPKDYIDFAHPFQSYLRTIMSEVLDIDLLKCPHGIDGCSIPSYFIPLANFSKSLSNLSAKNFTSSINTSFEKLLKANLKYPEYVSGREHFDLKLSNASQNKVYVKSGAEGVICSIIPSLNVGMCLKCIDGSPRAVQVSLVEILTKLFKIKIAASEKELKNSYFSVKDYNQKIVGKFIVKLPWQSSVLEKSVLKI